MEDARTDNDAVALYWARRFLDLRQSLERLERELVSVTCTVDHVLGALTVAKPDILGLAVLPPNESLIPEPVQSEPETQIERVEITRTDEAASAQNVHYLSARAVAKQTGVTQMTVSNWAKTNKIRSYLPEGRKVGRLYCIEDAEEYTLSSGVLDKHARGHKRPDITEKFAVIRAKRGSIGEAIAAKNPDLFADLQVRAAESALAAFADDAWISLDEASTALGIEPDALAGLRDLGMVKAALRSGKRAGKSTFYRPSEYAYEIASIRALVEYLPLVVTGTSWEEIGATFAAREPARRRG